ncbi:EamA family transporter, partial [Candidatus Woesearchaeota archaeon]|nr:EamA family transporter [Candidatus Woesearchaeota archaeon]
TLLKEHSITFLAANKLFQLIIVLVLIPFINFNITLSLIALLAVIAVLNMESDIFWTKALKRLDISIAAPLTNLSPAFVVILAYFMLNERITLLQILGVILIVGGAYVLEANHGFNFKNVYNQIKKSRYSIILFFSLLIGAFSAIGERYILGNKFINPIDMLFFFYLFTTILVLSIQFNNDTNFKKIKETIKRAKLTILVTSVAGVLTTGFYYLAVSSAYVSLVLPILLISTLLITVVGGGFFKEKRLLKKAIACIIMLIGVFLIINSSI